MSEISLPADERNEGAFATLRRGLRMMPEFRRGLPITFLLALLATAGRVVVPIAVQQTIDKGLSGPGGADLDLVRDIVIVCAAAHAAARRGVDHDVCERAASTTSRTHSTT